MWNIDDEKKESIEETLKTVAMVAAIGGGFAFAVCGAAYIFSMRGMVAGYTLGVQDCRENLKLSEIVIPVKMVDSTPITEPKQPAAIDTWTDGANEGVVNA